MDATGTELWQMHDRLEDAALRLVGEVVMAFSALEFNLAMSLRNLIGGATPEFATPVIDRLTFKSKLDALRDVVQRRFADFPQLVERYSNWHCRADAVRSNRNAFVHGRWGFAPSSGIAVNIAPGSPGDEPQRQKRFTLAELSRERDDIRALIDEFHDLCREWPL